MKNNTVKQSKKQSVVKRNTSGLKPFVKGQSGNPLGKKKGTLDEVTKFKQAIEAFEKEQNKDIYKFILDKASRYPQVLIAIFKALIPQQQYIETKDLTPVYEEFNKKTNEELINDFADDLNRYRASTTDRKINPVKET